jgi:hypothetical protein
MFSDSGNPYLMDEDALVDISPEGTGFMVNPSHHIAHIRIVLWTLVQVVSVLGRSDFQICTA